MRWILLLMAGLIALVAELTLFGRLAVAGARPEPMLALALLIALAARHLEHACGAAWLLGLMADVPSASRMGTFSLIFLVAAAVAFGLKRVISGDSIVGQIGLIALFSILLSVLEGVAAGSGTIGAATVAGRAFATGLYTAVLVPVLALVARPLLLRFASRN